MLNEIKNKTITYSYVKEFCVDIVETDEMYDAWIYEKNTGIKSYMFGITKDDYDYDEAKKLIEKNVNQYIPIYLQELGDLEQAFTERFLKEKE